MKQKKKIVIIMVGMIAAAIVIGVLMYNSSSVVRVRKRLEFGQKYLEEMNYEQAVIAFEIAIEIDPMNVEAYLGLSKAYVGIGDENKAFEVLELGYVQTQNEELEKSIRKITEEKQEIENLKNESDRKEEMTESKLEDEIITEQEQIWEVPDKEDLNRYLSQFTEFLWSYDTEKGDSNSLMGFVYEYIYFLGKGETKSDGNYVYISNNEVERIFYELFNMQGPKEKVNAYYSDEKILYDGEHYKFVELDYSSMAMSLATVKDIEELENGRYKVDFMLFTVEYILEEGNQYMENPIEDWDTYYAYTISEAEEDIFCTLTGTGTAKMHYEDDGRLILDYLNTEEAEQKNEQSKASTNVYGVWENLSAESVVETLALTLNEDKTAVYYQPRTVFYGTYELNGDNGIIAEFTYGETYSQETTKWHDVSNIQVKVIGTLSDEKDYMDIEIIDVHGWTYGVYNMSLTHVE